MNREKILTRIKDRNTPWDLAIIGGGATGVGTAVDAAARGHATVVLEQHDFGKGTSSRSTKLVHGGVRYLEQGNVSLVMEALRERGILRRNAPHLVKDLAFVVPTYDWWEGPFYGIGLKIYDLLAGKYGFGKSRLLSRSETIEQIPTIADEGLRGGVVYYDGQFDDARLLINLVQTAANHGATLLNYAPVEGFLRDTQGFVNGVKARDLETGEELRVRARVVVNATGPFSDGVRRLDVEHVEPMLRISQGAHVVLDRSFLPGEAAIMVPHTSDKRVLFAVPWHDHVVVGTTDTPIDQVSLEPQALAEEIHFILNTAGLYLHKAPSRADVQSVFVGIRPLVRAEGKSSTAALSRDHVIRIEDSGLLTVCGGKWTTYRKMAEDVVDEATTLANLPVRPCPTRELPIHGSHPDADRFGALAVYGSDAPRVKELIESEPRGDERLHPDHELRAGEVVWAVREERARTVEDMLARRARILFLDARAAIEMAPRVAEIVAACLGRDAAWIDDQVQSFSATASTYFLP